MTVSQWPHMTISGQSKRSWTLLVGGNVPTVPVYWCRWVTNLPPWFYDIYPSIYLSIWLSHPLGREGLPHPTHRTRSANRESGFTVCYSGGFTKRLWHRDGFGVWKLRASGNLEVSRVSWTVRVMSSGTEETGIVYRLRSFSFEISRVQVELGK